MPKIGTFTGPWNITGRWKNSGRLDRLFLGNLFGWLYNRSTNNSCFLFSSKCLPQILSVLECCSNILVKAFFKEDNDVTVGTLFRIAKLDFVRPFPESGCTPGAANLD
jgi:hypothetical protein